MKHPIPSHLFELGPRKALLLVICAIFLVGAPLVYASWFFFGGGEQVETRLKLERLAKADPEADARLATAAGDLRLLLIGYGVDREVPSGKWQSKFGYVQIPTFTEDVTQDQRELNHAARAYVRAYNRVALPLVTERGAFD